MIVPAPPPKFVQSADELVVGEKYHIDSGMGGVWVVTFVGRGAHDRCLFEYKNKDMADSMGARYSVEEDLVSKHIRIIQKFDTIEEWQAAGGRWRGRG